MHLLGLWSFFIKFFASWGLVLRFKDLDAIETSAAELWPLLSLVEFCPFAVSNFIVLSFFSFFLATDWRTSIGFLVLLKSYFAICFGFSGLVCCRARLRFDLF